MLRTCLVLGALLATTQVQGTDVPFRRCFDLASQSHNVDVDLLLAVAAVESNWRADARSSANAHGIMQIRWPLTARHLGAKRVAELYNPCLNIDMGARYLNELSDNYNGDTQLVLAAYNYGPTRIRRHADIPGNVQKYIDKVSRKRSHIAGALQASVPEQLASDTVIEVIRFNSPFRAASYVSAIRARVPGIALQSLPAFNGENIVYLNTTGLDANARYRLSQVFPQLVSRD
jgi:hypothetical protein